MSFSSNRIHGTNEDAGCCISQNFRYPQIKIVWNSLKIRAACTVRKLGRREVLRKQMWYFFLVGKMEKGRRKRRAGWVVVDRSTNSNFQTNSGIKILNRCKYLEDQYEMNYNQQVVSSQCDFLLWYGLPLCLGQLHSILHPSKTFLLLIHFLFYTFFLSSDYWGPTTLSSWFLFKFPHYYF